MHNRLRDAIAVLSLTFIFSSYASDIRFVDVTEQAGIYFEHAGGIDLRVVPALVGSGAGVVRLRQRWEVRSLYCQQCIGATGIRRCATEERALSE